MKNFDGNKLSAPISDPDLAHRVWIDEDLLPGLAFVSGGTRQFKIRRDQERYTFAVRNYFEGYVVPQWEILLQLWTREQYDAARKLFLKYAPHPIGGFNEAYYRTFTNKILNDTGFRVGLIDSWQPVVTPTEGMLFTYKLTVVDDYPLRWPPAPPKEKKADKGSADYKMPQTTVTQINPLPILDLQKRLKAASEGRQDPGAGYRISEQDLAEFKAAMRKKKATP